MVEDEFIGTEITTNKSSILTVIDYTVDNRRVKRYVCKCSVCSNDKDLWPLGSIVSPKYNLLKGNIPCGCALNPKWKEFQWQVKIRREADKRGYLFSGWKGDEFKGDKTKLLMHNPETGNSWDTSSAGKFISGQGDPKTPHHLSQRKPDDYYVKMFIETGKYPEGTIFKRDNFKKDKYDCHSFWDVTCPLCEKDLFGVNGLPSTFSASNISLRRGAKPCRCHSGYSKTLAEQIFYLKYLCDKEGHTYHSISGDYVGSKYTKFNWACKEGHNNLTNIYDFDINSVRCRDCYDNIPRTRNGYYKDRVEEDDMLYVLLFTRDNDSFIKVGRSFVVTKRARELDLVKLYSANKVDCLLRLKGKHQDIWDLEQQTLDIFKRYYRFFGRGEHKGGSECLSAECTENVLDYIEEQVKGNDKFFTIQERKPNE